MKGASGLFGRFFSIFSAKVVTTIIAIVTTPIIVRLLGPADYGDYAVFLSIFTIYMIPVSSGITEGVQKFVAESRETDYWQESVIRFYTTLAIVLVFVGVSVLVVVTLLGLPGRLFGEGFTIYFYLLTVFVLVAQFRALCYHIILGFGLEPVSESLNILKKVCVVGIGIGLVLYGYGVSGMILGNILADLIVAILAAVIILRRVSFQDLLRSNISSLPYDTLLSFNAMNIGLVFLLMSLYHVDIIMLQIFTGSETTGFYKAALQLAEYLWVVPIALQLLLLHSSSTLWSENRTEDITDIASRVTRYTVLVVGLMAIGLAGMASRFVPFYYGSTFSTSVGPLLLLLPGAVGLAVARPLQAISQGSGEVKKLLGVTAVAATLNFVLNAALIPPFGMWGAAVATSIGYGSMFGLYVWVARDIGYDPLDDFRGLRIVATVGITAPVIVGLDAVISSDLLAFVVVPVTGTLVYLLAALGVGAVDREELAVFLGKLSVPFGRAKTDES